MGHLKLQGIYHIRSLRYTIIGFNYELIMRVEEPEQEEV